MSTSQKCSGCRSILPKKEYLQCATCKAKYDLACANISSKSFTLMERRDLWKCPECTSKRPKKGNDNTPVRSAAIAFEEVPETELNISTLTYDEDRNITHRNRSTLPLSPNGPSSDRMKNVSSPHSELLNDLKLYLKELLHTQTNSIREAIKELTNTVKAQNSRIEQLETRIKALENKSSQEGRNSEITPLESVVLKLQEDIAERDQALLSNDVEIVGCPETTMENCTHIVLSVAKKVGVVLEEKDIVEANRVGAVRVAVEGEMTKRSRPIMVRLARRITKDVLLEAARSRRNLTTEGLNLPEPAKPLYINERLTKANRLLFQKARLIARQVNYKYVWTREGKIFARLEQGKLRHYLRNEADLQKVFGRTNI